MRNISPSNRKPSAAGSGVRTEDLWATCRPPYPLCHSDYPSGSLLLLLLLLLRQIDSPGRGGSEMITRDVRPQSERKSEHYKLAHTDSHTHVLAIQTLTTQTHCTHNTNSQHKLTTHTHNTRFSSCFGPWGWQFCQMCEFW